MTEREIFTTVIKLLREEYHFYLKGYGTEMPTHVELEVEKLKQCILWAEGKLVEMNDMEYPKETNYT